MTDTFDAVSFTLTRIRGALAYSLDAMALANAALDKRDVRAAAKALVDLERHLHTLTNLGGILNHERRSLPRLSADETMIGNLGPQAQREPDLNQSSES